MTAPALTGVVIHWHGEAELGALIAAWPRDPRFPLLVVDNGSSAPLDHPGVRVLRPGRNLGFAAGANLGITAAESPLVLLLNPDVRPRAGALDALLAGFAAAPEAIGLAPRLLGPDGAPQHRWQLRPLPGPLALLGHALFLPGPAGPAAEPPAGVPIAQPAAAALALRRDAVLALGGFDERFFPAWFEDVDLARRLAAAGETVRYWPTAEFEHQLGASVGRLGYGRFLWSYSRNLERYLRRHHPGWAFALRPALAAGALLRLALLPLRRPRRAASRADAAAGLLALGAGALSGWRRPDTYRRELSAVPASGAAGNAGGGAAGAAGAGAAS